MGVQRQHVRTNSYNRLVTVTVAAGSLVSIASTGCVLETDFLETYGYCSAVIGSTIGQPGWYAFFNLPVQGEPGYATTTTNAIATANGLYSSGGAVGSLWIMWAAMALGRKLNIQLGAVLAILGGALQGGAANLG